MYIACELFVDAIGGIGLTIETPPVLAMNLRVGTTTQTD